MGLNDLSREKRASKKLRREYRDAGVTDVFFIGFMSLAGLAAWFVTTTDAERDVLQRRLPELTSRVAQVLRDVGFDHPNLAKTRATVESQETVDRDYESRWWYAVK